MNYKKEFEDLWCRQFPTTDPPYLSCFVSDDESNNCVFKELVQDCLSCSRTKREELQAQIERENFVTEYLANIMESLTQANSTGDMDHFSYSSVSPALGTSPTTVSGESESNGVYPEQPVYAVVNKTPKSDFDDSSLAVEPIYNEIAPRDQEAISISSIDCIYDNPADSTATPVSSEDDEVPEVHYENIEKLRKQRRLTQTMKDYHMLGKPFIFDTKSPEMIDIGDEEEEEAMGVSSDGKEVPSEANKTAAVEYASVADIDKLRMRKWVVNGILESERQYVDTLKFLQEVRNILEKAGETSQPVVSAEDIECMFFKIPALHQRHSDFVAMLEPVVKNWTDNSMIGNIFKEQAVFSSDNVEYLKNYQKAMTTFHRCCQESERFREMSQAMKLPSNNKEVYDLDELLHKPVVRFQRGTLVLHDLLKSTPTCHKDHNLLLKAQKLTQFSLEMLGADIISAQGKVQDESYLVRNRLIVEQVGNSRKLRSLLLFNNVLVCAKQRSGRQYKQSFEVKWHIPLTDLCIPDTDESEQAVSGKGRDKNRQEIETLREKVKGCKSELRREESRIKKQGSVRLRMSSKSSSRNVEKLKKKVADMETTLVLYEPNLLFALTNQKQSDKLYKFLLCSDYERNEWKDVFATMKSRALPGFNMSSQEVQRMLDNCQQLASSAAEETAMRQAVEKESMNGFLNVTVHKLEGLDSACDLFTCIEVDSYGHFYMKAKTIVVSGTTSAEWNQDFEIELDASNTLRIMCYKRTSRQNVLLGQCALELSSTWLKESFQEKTISLNELSLTVSIRFTPREKNLRKSLCRQKIKQRLFGAPLSTVTRQEKGDIPLIVTACIEEVERRGLNEVGIYRVSGVTSDVQELRNEFEKGSSSAVSHLKKYDINAVTGLLKLYLRELPEALFTDNLYTNLADANEMVDPDGKRSCMISLVQSLPEPNFSTVVCLLNHLLRVSIMEHANKMSQQNLATIFGPTMLRPALPNTQDLTPDVLLSMETKDAMTQSGILLYLLTLLKSGVTFVQQEEKVTQF